jgi:uncharacterized damage-inducible protein DinB
MYRKIEDFLTDWKYESEKTMDVFRALSEESMSQKVSEEGRTLGFLAWHLATTLTEMPGQAGMKIEGPSHDLPGPVNPGEIAAAYEQASKSIAVVVPKTWTDEQLTEELPMYGQTWTKGTILHALIAHQIHHRGQMTVLMRQAGLRVPGIYGPAREEWETFGMPEMP